jgi:Domain of unknown function (DUF5916)/Carbohydrate family 9 binding domain-like
VSRVVLNAALLAAGLWAGPVLGGHAEAQATATDQHQHIPEASGSLALDPAKDPTPALAADRYRIEPRRVPQGPTIDGRLDEEMWLLAAVIDNFVQQEPLEGAPATERTVVRLLYDSRALYIGVHAYDANPGAVIATEMRRDSRRILDEDNFQIILDTFHDRRSGYMFVTSALGAKLEQQISEEGEGGRAGIGTSSNVNVDWDGVWHVSSRQTPEGWVAEIAIPLVTLRFPKVERQVWGVNFMRNIRHKNEQVFWAPVPTPYTLTRVSLAGMMTGMASLSRGMDLRLSPFVLGGVRQDRGEGGLDGRGFRDAGLDVKYGIGSGLNLDVTVNTDFAEVEVDEQQVNLTRFPLFFPEKRDFFLENAGMFSVKNEGGLNRLADLFFTRRIGLSSSGQEIPILSGGRLTGKIDRHNVAVLNIQTQRAFGRPGENFFVGRYSRDILSRSRVGGIIVNKESIGDAHYNRTFAVDTSLALHRYFVFTGFLAGSDSPGRSGRQAAGSMNANWTSPSWRIYGEYTDIQDNFNAEVGFVPRVGIRRSKAHAEWNPRPGRFNIRRMDPMMNIVYTTDQNNRLVSREHHNMVGFYFDDGSSVVFIYNDIFEQLDEPFRIRPDIAIPAGTYRFGQPSVSYGSNPSHRLYARGRYSPQTFFGGTLSDYSATVGLRPTSRFAAEMQLSRSDVDLPWGAFIANLASARLDFAFSPEMTLRTLSQYNSTNKSVSTSVRFNWIYSPGSDLYIAYDEFGQNYTGLPWIQNRQLAIKMTYLLSR